MPDRVPYEIQELIKAASDYYQSLAETIVDSEQRVHRWLTANECMVQFFPLSQEAVTIGSDRWYTTKAAWNSKDEAGHNYQHGFDADNQIQLIRYHTQVRKVFVHCDHFVDELVLAGDSLRGLIRHVFSKGRLASSSLLSWPGLALTSSGFTYDGDYLLEQRVRYSEIDQVAGTISANELEQVYSLKWDDATPTKNLCQVTSNFEELLYVGYHHRKLLHRAARPMVAFTLDVDDVGDESGGDGLAGQCYSLEMTADFDWEFDRVLFCLPDAVFKITHESDVCNTRLQAGGSNVRSVEEIRAVAEQGGEWVWIDFGQNSLDDLLNVASQNGLKILLSIDDDALVNFSKVANTCTFESAAVVLCNLEDPEPTKVRKAVRAIREALKSAPKKIRIITPFDTQSRIDIIDFIQTVDADGVYLNCVALSQVIPLLNLFGLHSYTSVPMSIDSRHVIRGL